MLGERSYADRPAQGVGAGGDADAARVAEVAAVGKREVALEMDIDLLVDIAMRCWKRSGERFTTRRMGDTGYLAWKTPEAGDGERG